MKQKNKTLIILSAVCLVFLALGGYVFFTKDTKIVGKILTLTGLVEIQKSDSNSFIKVFENMSFTEGDMIQTGDDGEVALALDENKRVDIYSDTKITFTELVKNINAESGKSYIELEQGKIKIKIDKNCRGIPNFRSKRQMLLWG